MAHRLPLADTAFIADFAAFARSKGDEEYCATDPFRCAVAQYGFLDVHSFNCAEMGVPLPALQAAMTGSYEDWRFNKLAVRLEALIAEAPAVERIEATA